MQRSIKQNDATHDATKPGIPASAGAGPLRHRWRFAGGRRQSNVPRMG
jgi:hypothetical protein